MSGQEPWLINTYRRTKLAGLLYRDRQNQLQLQLFLKSQLQQMLVGWKVYCAGLSSPTYVQKTAGALAQRAGLRTTLVDTFAAPLLNSRGLLTVKLGCCWPVSTCTTPAIASPVCLNSSAIALSAVCAAQSKLWTLQQYPCMSALRMEGHSEARTAQSPCDSSMAGASSDA